MIRSNLFRVNIKVLPQHIIVASRFKQCTTLVCDENILYIIKYDLAYMHDVKMKTQNDKILKSKLNLNSENKKQNSLYITFKIRKELYPSIS